ncbi:unnamed protein product, partial [Arabidopsis halleri]
KLLLAAESIPLSSKDAKKQKDDEEAKQLLVDMIVNETLRNTNFMQNLRKTKVDTVWDEKRKQEKEELKKKRDEMKKKREQQQKNKQDKAMGKKNKK